MQLKHIHTSRITAGASAQRKRARPSYLIPRNGIFLNINMVSLYASSKLITINRTGNRIFNMFMSIKMDSKPMAPERMSNNWSMIDMTSSGNCGKLIHPNTVFIIPIKRFNTASTINSALPPQTSCESVRSEHQSWQDL